MKTLTIYPIIFGIFFLISIGAFAQENALHLDGVNDFVDCGTDPSLDITGTNITLEAWVYPTAFTPNVWQGNVINKNGSGDRGYMLRVGNSGQVNFNIGTGSWNEVNSPTGAVTLNAWHHIAGTYDGTTMRVYVNGVEVATGSLSLNIGHASNDLYLGEDPQFRGRYFPGRIDEVKIWNSTRSAAEIVEDMNNSVCNASYPNLISYYKFNQGVANGNNGGVTTVIDERGTANGTLMRSSLSGTTSNWVDGKTFRTTMTSASICQGDSIMLGGSYQTTAGTYTDSIPVANGCDSLVVTTLTVLAAQQDTVNVSICQGDSIMLGGSYQTTAGTYIDSLQTVDGCDSIVVSMLTVYTGQSSTASVSICQGDSIMLGGSYQTTAGTYTDSLQTVQGCDSVIVTTLTILPSYSNTNSVGICQGDSIMLGGSYQTTAGTYTDSLQTVDGCDSVIVTTLTVWPSYNNSNPMRICQGDSIMLGGSYQTTAGTYTDSLQTIHGCDSIVVTTLAINPLPVVAITAFSPDTVCQDAPALALPAAAPLGGTYSGNGVVGTTFDPSISGVGMHYVVYSYTDANNCLGMDSTHIKVALCMGIEQLAADNSYTIFPNPVEDVVSIKTNTKRDEAVIVQVVNTLGVVVKEERLSNTTSVHEMDLSTLSEGVYFMVISTKGNYKTYKITKE